MTKKLEKMIKEPKEIVKILSFIKNDKELLLSNKEKQAIRYACKVISIKKSNSITKEEYINIATNLLDMHFPKNKCKERGEAMVLIAELYIMILANNG